MLYLIDTSAWIPALKGKGNDLAAKAVGETLDDDTAATCPVIMLELLSCVLSEKHYRELHEELEALHFIPITDAIWKFSYRLGFDLRKNGLTVPATDVLIASVAINSGCAVLHCDKHFDLISKHTKLQVLSLL